MGSWFSTSKRFSLPPYDYYNKVYPFTVAEPVDGDKRNGSYRNCDTMNKLWDCPVPEKPWIRTSLDVLKNSYEEYGDRDSLGERKVLEDGSRGDYEYYTFKELYPLVVQLGRGMRSTFPWLERQGRVGFFGKNCRALQMYSLAMLSQDQVAVPIYDTLGDKAVEHIIRHSGMTVIAVTEEKLSLLSKVINEENNVRGIVLIGTSQESSAKAAFCQALTRELCVVHYEELFCVPFQDPVKEEETDWVPTGDSVMYILYTSGTTGLPKGVVLKHTPMLVTSVSFIHAILKNGWLVSNADGVFSYLPLAHGYESAVELALLIVGARIAYYSGSLHNLLDDLHYAKPTLFIAVPRVLQRIQQSILNTFQEKNWFARRIIQLCLWRQTMAYRKGHRIALYDRLVFNKVKEIFGGHLRCLASGGAPLSGELSEFLQVCCGVPILEGYGSTETGAACTVTINNGHLVYYTVGAPLYGQEIRLLSLPDVGYTTSDDPCPRGEVLVRGPSMFSGYYRDEALTKTVVDEDGWFHTGDVGRINPDGSLSIIDRIKSLIKLSQGEYIAIEAVEAVFSENSCVAQIFVYGDAYENSLVAIAAPNPAAVIPIIKKHAIPVKEIGEEGWKASLVEACKEEQVIKDVMDELNDYGKRSGLKGFELIKGLYLDGNVKEMDQIFTVDNGMMTPTFKLKRAACYQQYKEIIKRMYKMIHDTEVV